MFLSSLRMIRGHPTGEAKIVTPADDPRLPAQQVFGLGRDARGRIWVGTAAGADSRLDDAVARLRKEFTSVDDLEYRARRIVDRRKVGTQARRDRQPAERYADDEKHEYNHAPSIQ